MSEEEIKDLFDAIDNRLILYQATNQIPNMDFDRLVKLSVAYEELQLENQQLKEQLKQRDEVIDEIANLIENTSINCDGQAEDLLGDISDILKKYKGEKDE